MKHNKNIEWEYKFQVINKTVLIKILDKLSFRKLERQYQNNMMFDNPQKLMQTSNGRIRVRTLGQTGNKLFTYKKPLQSEDGIKKEIEYEISFDDREGYIEKILEAMEFRLSTSYERYQTRWDIDDVCVTLDEYPFADFIEIEGTKKKIKGIVEKLDFNISDSLTKPIDTLFQEWRKKYGLPYKLHMKFDDFDK